jgi:hypothetical protein
MLPRALTSLTLLLALAGGAEPVSPGRAADLDHARAARRAPIADDLGGCREAEPAPVAAPACADEARP